MKPSAFVPLFIVFGLILSSCSSAQPPAPTAVPTADIPPTPVPPTLTPVPPTPTPLPTETARIPLTKTDVEEIENSIIAKIKSDGPGTRYLIKDSTLMGTPDLAIGGLVWSEGDEGEGSVKISTEFPSDVLPIPNMYNQKVWRFRGKVPLQVQDTAGATVTYTFYGEGDDLNLLTFGRFPEVGFVYLRGKGRLVLPDGSEVKLGY
jgi:hypothetical protein